MDTLLAIQVYRVLITSRARQLELADNIKLASVLTGKEDIAVQIERAGQCGIAVELSKQSPQDSIVYEYTLVKDIGNIGRVSLTLASSSVDLIVLMVMYSNMTMRLPLSEKEINQYMIGLLEINQQQPISAPENDEPNALDEQPNIEGAPVDNDQQAEDENYALAASHDGNETDTDTSVVVPKSSFDLTVSMDIKQHIAIAGIFTDITQQRVMDAIRAKGHTATNKVSSQSTMIVVADDHNSVRSMAVIKNAIEGGLPARNEAWLYRYLSLDESGAPDEQPSTESVPADGSNVDSLWRSTPNGYI